MSRISCNSSTGSNISMFSILSRLQFKLLAINGCETG